MTEIAYTVALPSTGYVPMPVICGITGKSKNTINRWCKQSLFPKPVKIGPNSIAWPVSQVRCWIADPTAWQAANAPKMEG